MARDGIRVLHVDDDAGLLEVARSFLESEGDLSVVTATSAADGLAVLDDERVDCVVSDYDMPGMDGLAFLDALRERGCDRPFILYTGHGNEAVASEAISRGVDDYLRKETGTQHYAVLANRIRNYVDRDRSERAAERARSRYELAGRLVSDVIYEYETETDEILFSEGFEAHVGVDRPDGVDVATWWLDRIHPDDRARVADRTAAAVAADERELSLEYRFEHGSGEWHHLTEDRCYRYEGGTVIRIVGAFRDVTDRRRREHRLDALHEASRDLMTVDTAAAAARTASRAAERVLDLPINAVYRRDRDSLRPVAHTDRAADVLGELPTLERGDGIMWEVVESGDPQVHGDVSAAANVYNPETPVRSELVVPVGEAGVFTAASTVADDFADTDAALAKVLAANLEAAFDRVE